MAEMLFKKPVVPWVKGTAKHMQATGRDDRLTWNRAWGETYTELGGHLASCATKGCPRAAAYALWYLGLVRGTNRKKLEWKIEQVYAELGKNAAYAVIAVRELQAGAQEEVPALWERVRRKFKDSVGIKPARSEQGEVKLVTIMHHEGELSD